jgi:hypothetical protein
MLEKLLQDMSEALFYKLSPYQIIKSKKDDKTINDKTIEYALETDYYKKTPLKIRSEKGMSYNKIEPDEEDFTFVRELFKDLFNIESSVSLNNNRNLKEFLFNFYQSSTKFTSLFGTKS